MKIVVNDSLIPKSYNSPLDYRTRIASNGTIQDVINKILLLGNPFEGQIVYDSNYDEFYVVTKVFRDNELNISINVRKFNQTVNEKIGTLETKVKDLEKNKQKTYIADCNTDSNESTKHIVIDNYSIDSNNRPKHETIVIIRFIKGNTCKNNIYLNINHTGSILIQKNGIPVKDDLVENFKLSLGYDTINNVWNIINNTPETFVIWD